MNSQDFIHDLFNNGWLSLYIGLSFILIGLPILQDKRETTFNKCRMCVKLGLMIGLLLGNWLARKEC